MYQEGMDMNKTTKDGTEYTLAFNGLYYWTRQGTVADALKGSYVRQRDALLAFNLYEASKVFVANKLSGEEDIDSLESKKDLLGYAEAKGVEVPSKYKAPSSIKKFLKGGYND